MVTSGKRIRTRRGATAWPASCYAVAFSRVLCSIERLSAYTSSENRVPLPLSAKPTDPILESLTQGSCNTPDRSCFASPRSLDLYARCTGLYVRYGNTVAREITVAIATNWCAPWSGQRRAAPAIGDHQGRQQLQAQPQGCPRPIQHHVQPGQLVVAWPPRSERVGTLHREVHQSPYSFGCGKNASRL